ncbi:MULTISPECIES: hypothetical protein [Symbiopectobacterium]|uniref:hypothetical protein n=1 Tax=Symbiopectobacterium TaxID=801 RepID=UPI001A19F834|nr:MULTISPECIES: hypothetical protein [Symbiopectobacterium]MBG6248230.1 hypothetical protein [Candidatus Symbiopectobacterium sp. PLON1]MBT9430878.1 hypothetical protein [Candidatus Symbiopectobacterium endolongispinus]
MRKLTAILVASTLAFGAAGIAHANDAQKGHGHEARMMKGERGGPRAGMHEEWMLKDLNLTEAQKKQFNENFDNRINHKMTEPTEKAVFFTPDTHRPMVNVREA